MLPEDVSGRIEAELRYARAARLRGKEGRARVCARRAAGWAIALYRHRQGEDQVGALRSLQWLAQSEGAPVELRRAAGRLVEQVDEDHQLPHSEDPIQDAELIISGILSEPN